MNQERRIELSKDATQNLRNAEEVYSNEITRLYPVGTRWACNHGTLGEYIVDIIDFHFSRGLFVKNVNTGKIKAIHWSSLIRQVNV